MTSTGNQDRPLFADMDDIEASSTQGAQPGPAETASVNSTGSTAIPLGAPEPRDDDRTETSTDLDEADPRGR